MVGFACEPVAGRTCEAEQTSASSLHLTDVIGLYLHPPQHAAVFFVDEKAAIKALDRKDPVLPLSPGRAERHGFEYYRHGRLSLYAAFNQGSGKCPFSGETRKDSAPFE